MSPTPLQWPDQMLFGAGSEGPGTVAALRRLLRYPYALGRDLLAGSLNLHAIGLVYATLLALIPFLAFSLGILHAFNAQDALTALLQHLLHPMGAAAADMSTRILAIADRVHSGVIGSVGLALLIWTLTDTMQRIEDGINYIWHVEEARHFTRRIAGYAIAIIVAPVLIATLFGLANFVVATSAVRRMEQLPSAAHLVTDYLNVAPTLAVGALFWVIYLLIPNTRVRMLPAFIGAVLAALLWAITGAVFSSLVAASTRLMVVYAGFAIAVAALLWTYIAWLILLIGALVSFYAQNPSYLRLGLRDLHLSGTDSERLALGIMYSVGSQHLLGGARLNADQLANRLGYPGVAIARVCRLLAQADLLITSEEGTLMPASDCASIRIIDILRAVRQGSSGLIRSAVITPAPVAEFYEGVERSVQAYCGGTTLEQMLRSAPVESGNGATAR